MSDREEARFPLSVVILAKNESVNIDRCVRAVSWCDDVVVIDDGSVDGTAEIAIQAGAKVVQHRFESFAKQRNWAILNAGLRHPWSLHLDADEVMTPELRREISEALRIVSPETVGFRTCRKTILNDRWLRFSDGFPVWIMRVVRNGCAEFADSGHGEVAVPEVQGTMGTLTQPFLHYPFSKGLTDWIDRHNRYSTREAKLEFEGDRDCRWQALFSRDRAVRRRAQRHVSRRVPCRFLLRLLYQYVWKGGFLDGSAGWQFSWLMATYESWIVAKRKELERQSREPSGR